MMMKQEKMKKEKKKDEIIQKLLNHGIFKLDGKQLYELPLHALIKEYKLRTG